MGYYYLIKEIKEKFSGVKSPTPLNNYKFSHIVHNTICLAYEALLIYQQCFKLQIY